MPVNMRWVMGFFSLINDVDDSGDILFLMLLHGWIRFSPIVNPLYLISYTFIIQYVYKLDVIPWSSGTATCWRFYTCLPKVYVLSVSPIQSDYITWCICITSSTRVTSPRNFDLFTWEWSILFFFLKKKWPTIKAYFPKWPKF